MTAGTVTAPPGSSSRKGPLLFEGADWSFDLLRRTYDAIEQIGLEELGLDIYRTQIEVITAEQMLDAYASVGVPLMYRHWSFGKRFAQHETSYRKGLSGLALEIVINSNPSLCYIMEENTMTMQATVLAHAAMGHNHFFKNNQVFRQWSDAGAILDYLAFAKRFVAECEERHGVRAVEKVLDAAHALSDHGIDRYGRRSRPQIETERARAQQRVEAERRSYNDLWRTIPGQAGPVNEAEAGAAMSRNALGLPEENLLYFIEKHAPKLASWERELIRIVRTIATYFEPQKQTKMMNEGCACWCHYEIMSRLHARGRLSEGQMLEFLHLHSSVVFQPNFGDPRFSGINPYALGYGMMRDIARICTDPTEEDQEWFPELAGNGRPVETLRRAWADFRDESFILQYLSPSMIRSMRLFKIVDARDDSGILVDAIHNERGYLRVRRALASHYDTAVNAPQIEVLDANLDGDRCLVMQHMVHDGHMLDALEARRVLRHLNTLWGYRVILREVDAAGKQLAEHEQQP